jgi:sugar O-acyltransferase (sialic acid O-acetyltransferase NeuD family)
MDDSITLYGASGHGKVVLDVLKSSGFSNFFIVDDNPKVSQILGHPVVLAKNYSPSETGKAIISIGNNSVRKRLSQNYPQDFIVAKHPEAVVASDVKLGNGTVVMARAVINPGAEIGKHCIINTGAVIEHDNFIADFAHISPAASLAGNVTIGEGTHIGIGAAIIQGITVGKWAVIGAGAVIINDVPDYAVVVGNPGKIIKYKEHE